MGIDSSGLTFLKNEFQTLSLNGALGRSGTYVAGTSEKDREPVKLALRKKLDDIARQYTSTVDDDTHTANICELADSMSSEFSRCLQDGRFRIGIAQKCLNLYATVINSGSSGLVTT